jgi:hypothetical protein
MVVGTGALAIGGEARGDEAAPPGSDPSQAPSLPEDPETAGEPDLQQQIEQLRAQVRKYQDDERRPRSSPLQIGGYVDFGFFVPMGNSGVGWVQDFGNRMVPDPEYMKYTWTFLGDILGTPVNTRGEAADLGAAPDVDRFDSVNSGGKPGFIANEVNVRLEYQAAERAILRTSLDFVPRSAHQEFALGDFFDVDLMEVEYLLTADGKTSIWAGKVLPVFGIEYKDRKADRRFGITPSLIQRYTAESQLGVKIRSKLFNDWLIVAASGTNNSSSSEQFHFHSEIDRNSGKMLNGRLAISLPLGDLLSRLGGDRLEIGGSGEWGPQDWATTNDGDLWMAGVDLQYLAADFNLKAQAMRGRAPGRPEDKAWRLELHDSGYVEIDWQCFSFLGLLARAELRDALVTFGMERLYVTKQYRYTGGLRVVFNPHIVAKLEYLHNQEYGGLPQINNDIFTSSLVLSY